MIRITLTIVFCLAVCFFGFAQSTTVFVSWSNSPNWNSNDCDVCGKDYACSNNFGDWFGGVKSFSDPIPAGNQITSVSVSLDYTGCGSTNTDVRINGVSIGNFTPIQDCSCPSSCYVTSVNRNGALPNYNYVGFNDLQIVSNSGDYICVADATITLNYSCVNASPASGINQSRVCPGTTTTLTVSGGSLPAGAEWHWFSGSCGGLGEGLGNSITVSPSSTTTYYVRAEAICNVTSCVQSTVTVTPQAGTFIWDGSESTDWHEACNWNSNIVPTSQTEVIIPGGTPNNPAVLAGQSATCRTLQIDYANGGAISVNSAGGATMTVSN